MGKGKKRDTKQRKTSNKEESSRSRQANEGKATTPAQTNNSKATGLSMPRNDGKFSKRKIISNWDRYSEGKFKNRTNCVSQNYR